MTYMNESGRSVSSYADYYGITPQQIVVITDDVALEFGTTRLRESGSSGGHNGLKSLIANLGTQQFARLRMGIGKPQVGWDQADYVLGKFTLAEGTQLEAFIKQGVEMLMSQVNSNKTLKTYKLGQENNT
jgi:PTH1 family peptidyl-tRNA hydrolase